jgi:hypothetical protein
MHVATCVFQLCTSLVDQRNEENQEPGWSKAHLFPLGLLRSPIRRTSPTIAAQ